MDNKKEKILILLAGQSNMSGRGFAEPEDLIEVPRVEFLRPDLKWAPAIEPITRDRDFVGIFNADGTRIIPKDPFETIMPESGQKVCGVGLGRTFGRLLAEKYPDREIGLIPTAVGGTTLSAWVPGGVTDWDPTGHPYDTSILRAKAALKTGRIAAILWHQGESDAKRNTPNYKEKLRTVVLNFRKDLALDDSVPFIAGDMASFYPPEIAAHIDIVDNALKDLEKELPSFCIVSTKDMDHRGDHLHFDTPSLHKLGARYFDAYMKFKSSYDKNKEFSHE